jgi:hypothetical protein
LLLLLSPCFLCSNPTTYTSQTPTDYYSYLQKQTNATSAAAANASYTKAKASNGSPYVYDPVQAANTSGSTSKQARPNSAGQYRSSNPNYYVPASTSNNMYNTTTGPQYPTFQNPVQPTYPTVAPDVPGYARPKSAGATRRSTTSIQQPQAQSQQPMQQQQQVYGIQDQTQAMLQQQQMLQQYYLQQRQQKQKAEQKQAEANATKTSQTQAVSNATTNSSAPSATLMTGPPLTATTAAPVRVNVTNPTPVTTNAASSHSTSGVQTTGGYHAKAAPRVGPDAMLGPGLDIIENRAANANLATGPNNIGPNSSTASSSSAANKIRSAVNQSYKYEVPGPTVTIQPPMAATNMSSATKTAATMMATQSGARSSGTTTTVAATSGNLSSNYHQQHHQQHHQQQGGDREIGNDLDADALREKQLLDREDDDEMDGKPLLPIYDSYSRSHPEVSMASQSFDLGGNTISGASGVDIRNGSLDSLRTEELVDLGLSTVPNQFCTVRDAVDLRKLLLLSNVSRGGMAPSSTAVMDMYMVGKVVGVGSYGKVRAAWHRLTGAKVAIKTYDKAKLKDPAHWKRVNSEIKITEQVSHPRIARMYEAVETPKRMHLIMECLDGGNLCSYVKQKRRLSEDESRSIFFQVLQAIEHLHTLDVAHRDIKLENVLFVDTKDIKLIDFGFATVCQPGKKLKVFCGTPSCKFYLEICSFLPYFIVVLFIVYRHGTRNCETN